MAYILSKGDKTVERSVSLIECSLSCYDCIGDPDFDWEMDELLFNRSALEFVRDRLNDAQRAELDTVDAYWKARPKAFNQCFAADHARRRKSSLAGWVEDEDGKAPAIPRTHWWWYPIEGET